MPFAVTRNERFMLAALAGLLALGLLLTLL
ncbi:hypothetical protein SAMN05444173_3134 [Opitutus sp. GAS368]|jgi:hypothetical protein|nr:hypothetical protein SAMN05444173_3134 [Opitutus sp. GAS368]